MRAVGTGAQWASSRVTPVLLVYAVAGLIAVGGILTVASLSPTSAATANIMMSRSEILSRPTSGAAWTALKARADSSIGTPDISNQDESADVTTLAKGLVYARIGGAGYRADVVAALKRAVGTETGGRTLALGRNLPGYVIAADLIDLAGADAAFDSNTFRPWLRSLLSETLDGRTLRSTHEDRPNNWGTHAGAARAAVAAYLGDSAELARTALVFRGWLGDRSAYAGFSYGELSWQCNPSAPVGINPPGCSRSGIALDGAIPDDMRRGGPLQWPPASTGYPWEGMQGAVLQAELLRIAGYDAWSWSSRALLRAAQFLYSRAGWPAEGDDEWQPWLIDKRYGTSFRGSAPARTGKNFGFTDWLYGPAGTTSGGNPVPVTPPPTPAPTATPTPRTTPSPTPTPTPSPTPTASPNATATASSSPTATASSSPTATTSPSPTPTRSPAATPTPGPSQSPSPTPTSGATPTAAPTPTAGPTPTATGATSATPTPPPAPTAAPTSAPTPAPSPTPTPRARSAKPPKVSKPVVKLSSSSDVARSGAPVLVDWALTSTEAGLRGYQLQLRVGGGDWVAVGLASATSSAARRTVPSGAEVRFRVRAIDRTGNVGDWKSSDWFVASALSDSSRAIRWSGTWAFVSNSAYLGRRAHWTKASGSAATMRFQGHAVAWAAPVGPTRGKARVILDGRTVATVDLYRRSFKAKDIVFARNVGEGTHTLRIQALGTRGRPTVAIDGLYVLRER